MREHDRYGGNSPGYKAVTQQARDAAARGEWEEAFDLLMEADAGGLLSRADLPLLGEVAYATGHLNVTVEAWERAHAASVQAGDEVAAGGAAVRVAMHLLLDTALMAPVRGWLARAERLLDDQDETSAHAWFAAVRTYERLLTGDLRSARDWARRAVEIGERCDPAASAVGRVAEARLLILGGDVYEGLALLDEVGVAVVSDGLDPLSTGFVYCELVCALQGLAQYDAAEEWTEAMERWCKTNAIGSLHGRCRVHRAEVLRLRGSLDEAESEALAAYEELRPYLRRELGWPLTELGRIRLRKGDVDGAEQALLAAQRAGWDPQPGLALVKLARGDVAAATAFIRDALDRPPRVPSKELPPDTELQRAPLLEAQVEIEIAAGNIDRARAAADELKLVAARFHSKALVAGASLARGRVRLAEGDATAAQGLLSEAVRLWNEVGAPYEAAVARMSFAEALAAGGSDRQAALELRAARAAFEPIDVAGTHEQPAAEVSVSRREGDYWSLMFEGRTVHVRDLKGMRYLARLFAHPGREFYVLDLVAAESPGNTFEGTGRAVLSRAALGDAGEMLDARAKSAYRRRLTETEADMEQARALGDTERVGQAEFERDFLVRELSRAVGLGGRDRRAASASERARVAVTRAIRYAIASIQSHDRELGAHLDAAIRTGTYCTYAPDAPRSRAP
jgi:tetratricopeptide (TPR) repeat protein